MEFPYFTVLTKLRYKCLTALAVSPEVEPGNKGSAAGGVFGNPTRGTGVWTRGGVWEQGKPTPACRMGAATASVLLT